MTMTVSVLTKSSGKDKQAVTTPCASALLGQVQAPRENTGGALEVGRGTEKDAVMAPWRGHLPPRRSRKEG